jgi:hypothetical protein
MFCAKEILDFWRWGKSDFWLIATQLNLFRLPIGWTLLSWVLQESRFRIVKRFSDWMAMGSWA